MLEVQVQPATRWKVVLGLVTIAATVFVTYFAALKLGFYGDDWIFYDLAGRLSLSDYLVRYFDPSAQTAWYRPVQGVLFRIEYSVFGTNPLGYHLLNVLLHLGNCFLIYALALRVTANRRIGFVAALIFASLPTAALTVFWPGVIDALETFFYLSAVWFWIAYLQRGRSRDYWLMFGAFLLALFTKEIGVTLPITLFLIDCFVIAHRVTRFDLVRRYLWFGVVFIGYFPIEYIVTRRSVFVSHEGYAASLQLVSNLVDYLSTLAFPWVFYPPVSYVWLAVAAAIVAYVIFAKKRYAIIPVIVGAALAVLPIAPFPTVSNRFLYLSLVASALLFASLFDWVWRALPQRRLFQASLFAVIAVIAALGSANISLAADDFGEWARVSRVPFRNISQAHPTFADDTLLYFIDPPVPGPNLSGMFLWRYGTRVSVRANDSDQPAGLRDHQVAYVYTFNAQGDQQEYRVEKETTARATSDLPVNFGDSIRLEGFELVSATIKKGQPIIALLYWRGIKPIDKDYTVFVHLIDQNDRVVAEYDRAPRDGKSPTSAWVPGQRIVDALQIPVPDQIPAGAYRLEVGLYNASTMQRAQVLDASGQMTGDKVLIEFFRSAE